MENPQKAGKQIDLTVLSSKMEVELRNRKDATQIYKESLEQDLKEKQDCLSEKKLAQTELQKINADRIHVYEYESEYEDQIEEALKQMSQLSNNFIEQFNKSSKNITDCVTRLSSLETLQANLIQDIAEIEDKKLQLGQQLKIKQETEEKLTEQCDKNEQQIQFLRTNLVKKQNQLQDMQSDLKNNILETEKYNWKISIQNTFCIQQYEQLLEENNHLDEKTKLMLAEAESNETNMKNQIENLKTIKLNNEQRVEALQFEIKTRQDLVNINIVALNDMKAIKDNDEKMLLDFQEKCSALEDQIGILNEQALLERTQFEKQANDINIEISVIKNNCSYLENEIQNLEKIIFDNETSITETKKFNESQDAIIAELKDKVKISNKILKDNQLKYDSILSDLESNLGKKTYNNIEAKTIQQALLNELNDLTTTNEVKKMRQEKLQKSSLEDEMEINIKIDELKYQKEALESEIAKAELELNSDKETGKQKVKELKNIIKEETKYILKNYNDEFGERVAETYLKKTKQLKEEIETLKLTSTNNQLQLNELKATIQNIETHSSLLDKQIEQVRNKKETLLKEVTKSPTLNKLSLIKATTSTSENKEHEPKSNTSENIVDTRSTLTDFSFGQPLVTSTPKQTLDELFENLLNQK